MQKSPLKESVIKSPLKNNLSVSINNSKKISGLSNSLYYGYFFSNYINYKYTNVCMSKFQLLFDDSNKLLYFDGKSYINLAKDASIFVEFISNCKKRFIVIPITLKLFSGYITSSFFVHTSILIFDNKLNELELFDPYGSTHLSQFFPTNYIHLLKNYNEKIDVYYKLIEKTFKSILGFKLKFFKPIDYFPIDSNFQNKEYLTCYKQVPFNSLPDFSVAWAFWYVEMRIQNPNLSRSKLVNKLLMLYTKKDGSKKICNLMNDYNKFIIKLDENTPFFEKQLIYFSTFKRQFIRNTAKIAALLILGKILYTPHYSSLYGPRQRPRSSYPSGF